MRNLAKYFSAIFALSSCAISLVSSYQLQSNLSSDIATNACTLITLSASSARGKAWTASQNTPVSLSGLGHGYAYSSLVDCKTGANATNTLFISAGSTEVSFFYRNATAENLTVSVISTEIGLVSMSQAVNVVSFEALGQSSSSTLYGLEKGFVGGNIVTDGSRFFLNDFDNNRVLIWNSIPTSNHQAPDVVVGQPSFQSTAANTGGISASTLSGPRSVYSTGTKLYVADGGNRRVLIWNSIPTTHGRAADLVLGQPDFISSTPDNGGVSASSLVIPTGVSGDGTHIFVADNTNSRILIWNTQPTSNFQAADVVLGQTTFSGVGINAGGLSASSLFYPFEAKTDGTRLLVVDQGNKRILIWNTIPSSNNQAANLVIGQPNFTTNTANTGGVTASSVNSGVNSVYSNGTQLFVSDGGNLRVLMWNTFPTVNFQAADYVIGQANLISATPAQPSATRFTPFGISGYSNKLFISDPSHYRVLKYNSLPSSNDAAADVVLGQPEFTSQVPNYAGTSSRTLLFSKGIASDGARLVIADSQNNRVLIWNHLPTANGEAADLVLGQPDFVSKTANNGGTLATSLYGPSGVCISGTRLFVSDTNNYRVLIWNSIPISNGQPADLVLGQPDMVSNSANYGGRSASSLSTVGGISCVGNRLFVTDNGNSRVLIWNSLPTVNTQAADLEIGQINFTTGTPNFGVGTSSALTFPSSVTSDGTHVFVVDTFSSRVLMWNTFPTSNGQAADFVLGQSNFTDTTDNTSGLTASSMSFPMEIAFDGTRLFVADGGNSRVLGWNTIPVTTGQPADFVLGQVNMTSVATYTTLTASTLGTVYGVFSDGTRVFMSDSDHSRVTIVPVPGL